MRGLAFNKCVAKDGDLGADTIATMASHEPPAPLAAIHTNSAYLDVEKEGASATKATGEGLALTKHQEFRKHGSAQGHFSLQDTQPQTMGYGICFQAHRERKPPKSPRS